MNVGTLRAWLSDKPADMLVLVAADSEGNSFAELDDVEQSVACAVGMGRHGVEWDVIHEDDVDDYRPAETVNAVVLWP